MTELLDFGTKIDGDGDPYECIEDLSSMIPEKHDYLFSMIQQKPDFENAIKDYMHGRVSEISLRERLSNLHPYFSKYPDAVVSVLNHSLASYLWREHEDEGSLQNMFSASMFGDKYTLENDINYWLMDRDDGENDFDAVEDTVYNARMFVAFVLDDSNPELAKLSSSARNSMYALTAIGTGTDTPVLLDMPVRAVMPQSEGIRAAGAMIDFDGSMQEAVIKGAEEIAEGKEFPPVWKKIASLDNGKKNDMEIIYRVNNFRQLIGLELYMMSRDNIRVNRCKECGRLFPVLSDGQEFCDFGENSHYQQFLQKSYSEELQRIYTKVLKTHRARVRNGKESEAEYRKWADQAKAVQEKAEKSGMKAAEFEKNIKEIG